MHQLGMDQAMGYAMRAHLTTQAMVQAELALAQVATTKDKVSETSIGHGSTNCGLALRSCASATASQKHVVTNGLLLTCAMCISHHWKAKSNEYKF